MLTGRGNCATFNGTPWSLVVLKFCSPDSDESVEAFLSYRLTSRQEAEQRVAARRHDLIDVLFRYLVDQLNCKFHKPDGRNTIHFSMIPFII
jgi:hypothetical protein